MGCGCGKPQTSYINKEVMFKGDWYKVHTEDRIAGNLGIIYKGILTWIRPSRVEGIR